MGPKYFGLAMVKREAGAMPARTRHCMLGLSCHHVTGLVVEAFLPIKNARHATWEDDSDELISEPGDLPEPLTHTASETLSTCGNQVRWPDPACCVGMYTCRRMRDDIRGWGLVMLSVMTAGSCLVRE